MGRSLKKGPYVDDKLVKKVSQAKATNQRAPIKTWARASMIPPDFVGVNFAVYDGKKHVPIFITDTMVGHRLGEFVPTRTFKGHPNKK